MTAPTAYQRACALEAAGEIDEAVAAYARAGAIRDAVRLLVDADRYAEAGSFVLSALGAGRTDLGALRGAERNAALRAAQYFEAGGEPDLAADVYRALGEHASADRVGGPDRTERAGLRRLLDDGQYVEVATELRALGRGKEALRVLTRVSRDDPSYRAACVLAIEISAAAGGFDVDVDRLVSRFHREPPRDDREARAMESLAEIYAREGFDAGALALLDRLLDARPDLDRAAALHERLSGAAGRGAARPRDRTVDGLPDLPDLDGFLPDSGRRMTVDGRRAASHDETMDAPLGRAPAPPVAPFHGVRRGGLVAGRYRLVEEIGRGGMAVVFRALDTLLDRELALKMMYPGAETGRAWARFRQELSLSRGLTHRNIVRVHDVGVHAGGYFISMELLEGESLEELIERTPIVPFGEGLDYMIQVCSALDVAHAQGIAHRDVKPDNIFLTREGVLKLMDFGIAKAPDQARITHTGIVVGTPEYMSPEQIDAPSDVGPPTDLYSLGVVMYEMFTGQLPFESEALLSLLDMHIKLDPLPPRRHNPAIPESLEGIILALLEKQPSDRPGSALHVARALRAVRRVFE